MLAIVTGAEHFRENIIGYEVTFVTDHKPLDGFFDSPNLNERQIRWRLSLEPFNFHLVYAPGRTNGFADVFSRYYSLFPDDRLPDSAIAVSTAHTTWPDEDEDDTAPRDVAALFRSTCPSASLSHEDTPAQKNSDTTTLALVAPVTVDSSPQVVRRRDLANTPPPAPPIFIQSLSPRFEAALIHAYTSDSLAKSLLNSNPSSDFFSVFNNLIFRRDRDNWRLYIPNGRLPAPIREEDEQDVARPEQTLREHLLDVVHEQLGHKSEAIMTNYLARVVYWPTMLKDIKAFSSTCDHCQRVRPNHRPTGLIHHSDVPTGPFDWMSMDFKVGLPVTTYNGRTVDAILVVVDLFSGFVILTPTLSTDDGPTTFRRFFEEVYSITGRPTVLVVDRDPKFLNGFNQAAMAKLGIDFRPITAHHHAANGRAERAVGETLSVLRSWCTYAESAWAEHLKMAQAAMNSAPATTTCRAPIEVVLGRQPQLLPFTITSSDAPSSVSAHLERMRLMHIMIGDAIFSARHQGAISANKSRQPDPPELQLPGAKAYLSTEDLKLPEYTASSFVPRFVGPYSVIRADPTTSTYVLDLPPHLSRLHSSFHVSRLRVHRPSDDVLFPGRVFPEPPPVRLDDGEAQWELEDILLDRKKLGRHEYLVRWKGYGHESDTWEPETNLRENASEMLDAYIAKHDGRLVQPTKGSRRQRK